jgi:exodeoxyribonuclease V alpha subunit
MNMVVALDNSSRLPRGLLPLAHIISRFLTQHYAMPQRNLLYTGVTRGKKLVVLVGQKKAVAIAVRNISRRGRWSKLNEWLRGASRQGYTVSKMIGP